MAGPDDLEDDVLDPPLPDENEPEDLQDDALVEDEADEGSEQDNIDVSSQQGQDDRSTESQRQPSRGERRFQALNAEVQRERAERQALQQRMDALLAAQTQPRQPVGEHPEQRAQRRAMLTPEERMQEDLNEAKHGFTQTVLQMQISQRDATDRAAFQAKATVDPYYKKWEDRVEAELKALNAQGQTVEREKLLFYLIGKAALEGRKGPKAQRERAQAARRVQNQTTRPSRPNSDVSSSRRERGNSLERRLENIEL